MTRLNFNITTKSKKSSARAASFKTLHSEVKTPVFMPVGTRATVKGQTIETLEENGAQVLLANTYHLLLRPGPEVFKKFGGIHNFMNWKGSVLTDSGGFQIFSLHNSREMNEEGAYFKSYIDGQSFMLTPELSIETQKAIGSDIMMVLDHCIPSTAGYDEAKQAMELTHRWAIRSLNARKDSPQSMFGIVQGACHHDLRRESASFLRNQPFDGFAIGGLAVGEPREKCWEFTHCAAQELPENLPRYLMGVGTPIDLLESVNSGVDMFDCIMPSQLGHRGTVFASEGKLQLRRTAYKFDDSKLDPKCDCYTCRSYSKAYLHHLIKSGEPLGWFLLTTHNLAFYHKLMRDMREQIINGTFEEFYKYKREELLRGEDEKIPEPPKRSNFIPKKSSVLGDYSVVENKSGHPCIKQNSSGEIMHSVNNPAEEADLLYIKQSKLYEQIIDITSEKPLTIWDVGLGAGTNAMAAISCFEKAFIEAKGAVRPVHIVSFEIDLDPIKLASTHNKYFVHLRHSAPFKLLQNNIWEHESELLKWTLCEGDFIEKLHEQPIPDIIFYDPFSPKTDGAMWTFSTFKKIHEYCAKSNTSLYTYSNSTAVRATLLTGGFFVGYGVGTGPKTETTVAFTNFETAKRAPNKLLGAEWQARWQRSGSPFPLSLNEKEKTFFTQAIENHPQLKI